MLLVDVATFETAAEAVTDFAAGYRFTFPQAPDGTYFVFAGTDRDDDGYICDGEDACGSYPDPLEVVRGMTIEDIDFVVGQLLSPQAETTPTPLEGSRRETAAPGGTSRGESRTPASLEGPARPSTR